MASSEHISLISIQSTLLMPYCSSSHYQLDVLHFELHALISCRGSKAEIYFVALKDTGRVLTDYAEHVGHEWEQLPFYQLFLAQLMGSACGKQPGGNTMVGKGTFNCKVIMLWAACVRIQVACNGMEQSGWLGAFICGLLQYCLLKLALSVGNTVSPPLVKTGMRIPPRVQLQVLKTYCLCQYGNCHLACKHLLGAPTPN